MHRTMISIGTVINAKLTKTWECWTKPEHIVHWNFASDEWCCPSATNELVPGTEFAWRMEAKDGSIGFDFTGTYDQVVEEEFISYTMSDGRKVEISFVEENSTVKLNESFEAEGSNSDELQRAGWQAILENFKKYVEAL